MRAAKKDGRSFLDQSVLLTLVGKHCFEKTMDVFNMAEGLKLDWTLNL